MGKKKKKLCYSVVTHVILILSSPLPRLPTHVTQLLKKDAQLSRYGIWVIIMSAMTSSLHLDQFARLMSGRTRSLYPSGNAEIEKLVVGAPDDTEGHGGGEGVKEGRRARVPDIPQRVCTYAIKGLRRFWGLRRLLYRADEVRVNLVSVGVDRFQQTRYSLSSFF